MAQTVSNIAARLADTLVIETLSDNTANDNVFTGTSLASKIYEVELDNTLNSSASYLKVQYATSYNTSNTPSLQLYCPGSSKVYYTFPEGLAFTTGFSFIGSVTAAATGTQTSPTKAFKVKILGGT